MASIDDLAAKYSTKPTYAPDGGVGDLASKYSAQPAAAEVEPTDDVEDLAAKYSQPADAVADTQQGVEDLYAKYPTPAAKVPTQFGGKREVAPLPELPLTMSAEAPALAAQARQTRIEGEATQPRQPFSPLKSTYVSEQAAGLVTQAVDFFPAMVRRLRKNVGRGMNAILGEKNADAVRKYAKFAGPIPALLAGDVPNLDAALDASGHLREGIRQQLQDVAIQKGGKAGAITSGLVEAIEGTLMTLWTFKAANIGYGTGTSTKGVVATVGKMFPNLSTKAVVRVAASMNIVRNAMLRSGLMTATTEQNSMKDAATQFGIGTAYQSTPAFSRWMKNGVLAKVADVAANFGISATQVKGTMEAAKQAAISEGHSDRAGLYQAISLVKMFGSDVVFGLMTNAYNGDPKIAAEIAKIDGARTKIDAEPEGVQETRPPVELPATGEEAARPPVDLPQRPEDAARSPEAAPDPLSAKTDTTKILDDWFANKDEAVQSARSESLRLKKEIAATVGASKYNKATQKIDQAIQLNIDLRGQEADQIAKYGSKLSPAQRELLRLSQNLTDEQRAIADKIIASNKATGIEAQDEGVIRNVRENYTARLWAKTGDQPPEPTHRRFATSTSRAKQRTLESILEGWAKGKELNVKGASEALSVVQEQIHSTIQDRALIAVGKKAGLFSDKQGEDTVRLEHPGFQITRRAGRVEEGKTYGKNFFVTEDGNVFERAAVYAPKALGKKLNKVLGKSKLYDIPGVKGLTRFNSEVKQIILATSFFHDLAFMRSYMLGARTGLKNANPRKAYKDGLDAVERFTPMVRELVRGGLTIGRMQEWDAAAAREKTKVGAVIDKIPVAGAIKGKLMALRDAHANYLFGKLGPGLKTQAAILEYKHLLKKHRGDIASGKMTRHDAAKMAANMANDDFGGLHLQRMGRSPEAQHIFRLLALAPDWTESNVRSMAKMVKGGAEGRVYRDFWARVAWKGAMATTLFNLLMAQYDDDLEGDTLGQKFVNQQKQAWSDGNLKWLGVNITPLAKRLGGKEGQRKYLSLIGHFRDPIKFVTHPVRSAKHKSSVIGRVFLEALLGQDWAGRRFTTASELLGVDDKGVYKRTIRGKHEAGDPKGGKLKGRTIAKSRGGGRALEYGQMPSFAISQAKGMLPIQVQNALAWLAGEMDSFDAIAKSIGVTTQSNFEREAAKPPTASGAPSSSSLGFPRFPTFKSGF